MSRKTKEMSHD